ncbi:cytochrome-c oxidase, cbb3-type subunit III [Denitrobaculum tricleocarpae]|uniref:Cbb3-type cytochrome c oxidase subunit n=1 Tax=Denitrobaculum tricleocarpae TaxID=2591009 RepID=A0A545ST11_9PROT|nr:cytochrome-c oxidase, cbb3-type subunit III [Denitrobaculum tricleocarpae]TQV68102.1 cytochrome-c oxidase, cbb3-type subunit III [Denitrobaculum tricleocarpae]
MAGIKETDEVTGVDTTGHEWDGIKELNNPLPRWWLWTFYACCIWSFVYWIFMPTWPLISDHTRGFLGYSSRANLTEAVAAAQARQSVFLERIAAAELEEIRNDADLLNFAQAGGGSAFAVNCSQCHGQGAAGSVGYPNLNDDDWIWGGSLEAIQDTILYGIRSDHEDTRVSDMPAFGRDELLSREEIRDTAAYVLSLSGAEADAEAAARGEELYVDNCSACHMEDGTGNQDLGAPNLADSLWLYGGDEASVITSINTGRGGAMPGWSTRLDPVTIKQLAVYVHSLGGGE